MNGVCVAAEDFHTIASETVPDTYLTVDAAGCDKLRCTQPCKACYTLLSKPRAKKPKYKRESRIKRECEYASGRV